MAEEFRNWLSGPPSTNTYAGTDEGGGAVYTSVQDPNWKPPSDLPTTKYGSYADVHAYDVPSNRGVGGFELINHDLWYDDPNYGPITPKWNTIDPSSQKNGYDMIGPIFAAVLGTAVGIPWYATMGLTAAKTVGGSDRENPMIGEIAAYTKGAAGLSPSAPGASSTESVSSPEEGLTSLFSRFASFVSPTTEAPKEEEQQKIEETKIPTTETTDLYSTLQESNKRLTTLYSLLSSDQKQV